MTFEDHPSLGPCCVCGTTKGVVNVLMINRRAPVPGTGWGCVVCGLPCDGAVAVLCDRCACEPPRFVCKGYGKAGERVPFSDLSPELFDHDPSKHADE